MSNVNKYGERAPLRIRPGFSRRLAAFLLTLHCIALGLVFAIPLDWYWRTLLVAAVFLGLLYSSAVHLLYLWPRAIREVTWGADGTWSLSLVSAEQIQARLLPSTYVSVELMVLNFRCNGWRQCALVLLPDALDGELLRRLRVRLRLYGAASDADTDAMPRVG